MIAPQSLLPRLSIILLLAACSSDDGGFGRPSVDAGPVQPITFAFQNTLDEYLYVDWPDTQPYFELRRSGVLLMTRRGCIPYCGDGCICSSCSVATPRVRRIPAGEALTVTWDPIHFLVNTCRGSTDCMCVESWPITADTYELTLDGFTQAEGGQELPGHPNLLVGVERGSESKSCTAHTVFDLGSRGLMVNASFVCL